MNTAPKPKVSAMATTIDVSAAAAARTAFLNAKVTSDAARTAWQNALLQLKLVPSRTPQPPPTVTTAQLQALADATLAAEAATATAHDAHVAAQVALNQSLVAAGAR